MVIVHRFAREPKFSQPLRLLWAAVHAVSLPMTLAGIRTCTLLL